MKLVIIYTFWGYVLFKCYLYFINVDFGNVKYQNVWVLFMRPHYRRFVRNPSSRTLQYSILQLEGKYIITMNVSY